MTSYERVKAVFAGEVPDRPPLFDTITNDAVIERFSGRRAEGPDRESVVYAAYAAGAVDATRTKIFIPLDEGEDVLPSGQKVYNKRWTSWLEHMRFSTVAEAAMRLREWVEIPIPSSIELAKDAAAWVAEYEQTSALIAPCVLIGNYMRKVGLMSLYVNFGWEMFSYLMSDVPGLVDAYLERTTEESVRAIDALQAPPQMPAVIACMDIAGVNGPLVSPSYLNASFFPRLERIADAWHRKGAPFVFHSDGNLMPIIDDLAACGIDGLHPIDLAAGLDLRELRRRFPEMIFMGGVDVVHLLPHGTPDQVRTGTRELLEIAGPKILLGSSTELGNDVPLENFLAMTEVAIGWRY